MDSVIETITPELAKEYLKCNTSNRPLRKGVIDFLAREIKEGSWKTTHQGIAFDYYGRLIDGQHRLHAIASSGIPVEILVTRGVDPSSFQVLDCGVKRTDADRLNISTEESGVISCLSYLIVDSGKPSTHLKQKVKAIIEQYYNDLYSYCGASRKFFSSAGVKSAAILSVMMGEDKEYVYSLYRDLVLSNFDFLPPVGIAIKKQEIAGKLSGISGYRGQAIALSKGLFVFSSKNRNKQRIIVNDELIISAKKFLNGLLEKEMKEKYNV